MKKKRGTGEEQADLFSFAAICLAKFCPESPLDAATVLMTYSLARQQWTIGRPEWAREQAFAFQRRVRSS